MNIGRSVIDGEDGMVSSIRDAMMDDEDRQHRRDQEQEEPRKDRVEGKDGER